MEGRPPAGGPSPPKTPKAEPVSPRTYHTDGTQPPRRSDGGLLWLPVEALGGSMWNPPSFVAECLRPRVPQKRSSTPTAELSQPSKKSKPGQEEQEDQQTVQLRRQPQQQFLRQRYDRGGEVRVMCRMRPRLRGETGDSADVRFPDPRTIVVSKRGGFGIGGRRREPTTRSYKLDQVFGPTEDDGEVIGSLRPLFERVAGGANVCAMAYGHSGSGKTHTVLAIINEAAPVLFRAGPVSCSIVEVHNDTLYNLATPGNKQALRLDIQHPQPPRAQLQNLSSIHDCLRKRTASRTSNNDSSSRSHLILSLQHHEGGLLTLVDLAGAERHNHTSGSNASFRETQYINSSLCQVQDMLRATGGKRHYTFRASLLTRLLAPSFQGDWRTVLLVTLGPLEEQVADTLLSLNLAERVAKV